MKIELAETVRMETLPAEGRRITRIFVGEVEIPHDPGLREAVARFCIGAELPPSMIERLMRVGILQPARPLLAPETALALRPEVAIDVEIGPRTVQVPTRKGPVQRQVRPRQSLPFDLFVPPLRLHALEELASSVTRAWDLIRRASLARGVAVDADAATLVLAKVALEHLEGDPALEMVLEIAQDSPLQLCPLVSLQEEVPQYPVAWIRFAADRDPNLAARSIRQPVHDGEHLAAISTLVGMLARGAGGAETGERLGTATQRVGGLMRQLWAADLLHEAPARAELSADLPDGTVVHLGHAALLARVGGKRLLFDPWLIPASSADPVAPPRPIDLGRPDAIFFTHHHWDHVELGSLLELDKDVPVFVPAQPAEHSFAPRTAALLRAVGFTQVHALAPGDQVPLGDGRLIALPFYGEDPTRTGFAGSCYLLESPAGRALIHVDSGTDAAGRSLVSTGELAAVRDRLGPIHTVFATRRQERALMVEHGWHFLLRPADEWLRPTENCDNDADFLASLVTAAGARQLVLYSEGGADWYPDGTDFLRGSTPRALDTARTWLWEDLATIQEKTAAAGATVQLSAPYDRFPLGG